MSSVFSTRITELYGIRMPVIASGLMWLANPEFVGAVVNAGLMGFMTAASFRDPGVRHAKKAESLGADAVTVVGAEAGVEPVGTMVMAAAAARAVKIPLVVAGVLGTGAHLVADLAPGADGVAMIQQIEKTTPGDMQALLPHTMGSVGRKAYESGEYEKAMLSCGQGVVFADKIESFATIVDRLEAEAHGAMSRLQNVYHGSATAESRDAKPLKRSVENQ